MGEELKEKGRDEKVDALGDGRPLGRRDGKGDGGNLERR